MAKFDPAEIKVIAERLTADEETSAMVSRMEREAEEDFAASTVSLRWARWQVEVVKRAAGIMGVPYQTYLKQVVFRQAVEDIARSQVLGKQPKATGRKSSSRSQAGAALARGSGASANFPSRPKQPSGAV